MKERVVLFWLLGFFWMGLVFFCLLFVWFFVCFVHLVHNGIYYDLHYLFKGFDNTLLDLTDRNWVSAIESGLLTNA